MKDLKAQSDIRAKLIQRISKDKDIFAVLLIWVLVLMCEIFLFNYKYWNSLMDKPVDVAESNIQFSGITKTEEGYYVDSNWAMLEMTDINREIKYLYFYLDGDEIVSTEIQICAKDEANSGYLTAPSRRVLADVKRSQYIRLHYSGEVSSLMISVSGLEGKTIQSLDIVLNENVPILFSWFRFLVLGCVICLLYLLRAHSFVWRYKTDLTKYSQKTVVLIMVVVQAICFWGMLNWNTSAIDWYKTWDHHRQYYDLIDAFENGRLDVGDAADELAELENPYDSGARDRAGLFFQSRWDHAYFQGKYYVYFGVVPAVLLYWPYQLLTGNELPNYHAVYFLGVMIMLGILFLLWQIVRRWFQNTPFVLYLTVSGVFGAASCLGYAVYKPDFYIVPIMTAIMFGLFGLGFWISAERKTAENRKKLITWRLVMGSLCIALIAGCRPQLLFIVSLGIILFWSNCFQERLLFSKRSIKQTVAICIPFVVVAALIMWYNSARFGSPFDFGANYNLTTNDMTKRGFVWGRTGLGIFSFLFQPVNVNAVFPFLHDFGVQTTYQGLTLTELMTGGIYWLFPILLVGLYGLFHKNWFKDRNVYKLVVCSAIVMVVIAACDIQMAGLLRRYFLDFVWVAMFGTAICIFAAYQCALEERDRTKSNRITRLTVSLSCITLIMVFLCIFAFSEDSIRDANPILYYTVQHLISFWM
ncbi:MAG: hypothetical protein J6L77_01720 [Coprococcus sp.]|nr:hypothetical protein [Coprococcus sp.]